MTKMKKKLNIALIGYGKMGKTIEKLSIAREHTIRVVIDNESDWDDNRGQLGQCDVAFEFTTPEAAPGNIRRCFDHDVAVVCGTTGWLNELPAVIRLCEEKKQCLFHASNFSIGVNIFFELNQQLARMLSTMKGYRPRIVESHHTQKLDAPSGTALTLANTIIASRDDLNRWGNDELELSEDTLPVRSYRLDDITGTHAVMYDSVIDSIEIKHTARDRSGFAEGAIMAAEWVHKKQGVFTMKEMLKL